MARAFVVADDLTGANTSAARMARGGLSALTVMKRSEIGPALRSADVVAMSTGSRDLVAGEAAARVRAAIEAGADVRFVAKRVDSTLRGNIGAELDSVLDVLGGTSRALVVPAFPSAGRTTVGGVQRVDGREIGRVAEVIGAQSRRAILEVSVDRLDGADAEVLVCDAASDEDVAAIAAAAARVDGIRWVPVCPGPFAVELARAHGMLPRAVTCAAPLLVVGGSATDLTRRQLSECERVLGARFVELDAGRLDVDAVVDRLCELAASGGIVGVRTCVEEAEPSKIAAALGAVARGLVGRCALGGLYVTGGEVTAAVVDALGASGIAVDHELLPLVVAGRLAGGCADGLPLITKGGLVGDTAAAVAALEHLRLNTRRDDA